jgi:hypothetical protein
MHANYNVKAGFYLGVFGAGSIIMVSNGYVGNERGEGHRSYRGGELSYSEGDSPVPQVVRFYWPISTQIDADGLGLIDADEFCSYLLQQLKERDTLSQLLAPPFGEPPKYRHNMCSKESICRLCMANSPMRFISISKVCQ